MGMIPSRYSSCGCNQVATQKGTTTKARHSKLPNPNPCNFEVEEVEIVNDYTILVVVYPDCTNFEGRKILVFKGAMPLRKLANIKTLDPHFCEHNPNLIARFRPGHLMDAIRFCKYLASK